MRLEDEIKQKEFKSEYHKGIVNLIYTFNWIDSKSKDFFKQFNLTPQQFNILRILRGQHPKPSTINLLKERMLDKMSDTSRIAAAVDSYAPAPLTRTSVSPSFARPHGARRGGGAAVGRPHRWRRRSPLPPHVRVRQCANRTGGRGHRAARHGTR